MIIPIKIRGGYCPNIALCGDENVLYPMGITLTSLLETTHCFLRIHIFYSGMLSAEEQKRFCKLGQKYQVTIIFYFLDGNLFSQLHAARTITTASYYRLFMPHILIQQDIHRVLYCDTDLLFIHDIQVLLEKNIQDVYAYTVKKITDKPEFWRKHCRDLEMKSYHYFNAGLMFINIDAYVKASLGRKALLLVQQHNFPFMDQDALNLVMEDKVVVDDMVDYNCTMSVEDSLFAQRKKYISVIHFTGEKKPWKYYTQDWGEKQGGDHDKTSRNRTWKYLFYKKWRQVAKGSFWSDVSPELPKNRREWRWLSQYFFHQKSYKNSIKAAIIYIKSHL